MSNNTNLLVRTAMVAAIYVVVTVAFSSLSYGMIQFRLSEVMVLLAFIDPLYIPGLVIGCFVANFIGPFGIVDAIFGSFASLVSLIMIWQTRKMFGDSVKSLFMASLWPSIFSFIIAFEIVIIYGAPDSLFGLSPFISWTLWVAAGEFVVISILGVSIFRGILKNRNVLGMLKIKKKTLI